ncbi:hypothetical protein AB4089_18430 [Arthrobacter sp. 2MCAF15]
MSDEPVGNVVPVLHGLPSAEGRAGRGVRNTVLPLAGAVGRLDGRDGGPVPRRMPWVAG